MKKDNHINKKQSSRSGEKIFFGILVFMVLALSYIMNKSIILPKFFLYLMALIGVISVLGIAITNFDRFLLIFVMYIPFSREFSGKLGMDFWALNLTNFFIIGMVLGLLVKSTGKSKGIKQKGAVKSRKAFAWFNFFVIIFCFLGVVSLFRASTFFGFFYFVEFISPLKRWIDPMLIFFLFLAAIDNVKVMKDIAKLMCVVVTVAAVLALKDFMDVGNVSSLEKMRIGGIVQQPNLLGAFFAYYTFLLPGIFLMHIRQFKYWFLIIPMMLCARALTVTFSRGAMLGFAIGAFFMVFIKNKTILILLIIGVAFVAVNPDLWPEFISARFGTTFKSDNANLYGNAPLTESLEVSSRKRIYIWEGGVGMVKQSPWLGVGYGLFPHMIRFYAPEITVEADAHNTYLLIAAEMGLFALFVFSTMLLTLFVYAWYVYKRETDIFLKGVFLGVLACIVSLVVCNFFGSRFDEFVITGYFWVLAAIVVKRRQMILEENINEVIRINKSS